MKQPKEQKPAGAAQRKALEEAQAQSVAQRSAAQGQTAQPHDIMPANSSVARLQALANASAQVAQSKAWQAKADNSYRVRQFKALYAPDPSPQAAPVQRVAINDDPALEHEADVMGAKAASTGAQLVQQQKAEHTDSPTDDTVQRAKAPQAESGSATSANTTQGGLPTQLKAGLENMSGLSMDDVKVHYNSDKPAQLQAHAYAQGTDIHLASGQEKHLAHEAWHVVQQKQGRVRPTHLLKKCHHKSLDRHTTQLQVIQLVEVTNENIDDIATELANKIFGDATMHIGAIMTILNGIRGEDFKINALINYVANRIDEDGQVINEEGEVEERVEIRSSAKEANQDSEISNYEAGVREINPSMFIGEDFLNNHIKMEDKLGNTTSKEYAISEYNRRKLSKQTVLFMDASSLSALQYEIKLGNERMFYYKNIRKSGKGVPAKTFFWSKTKFRYITIENGKDTEGFGNILFTLKNIPGVEIEDYPVYMINHLETCG